MKALPLLAVIVPRFEPLTLGSVKRQVRRPAFQELPARKGRSRPLLTWPETGGGRKDPTAQGCTPNCKAPPFRDGVGFLPMIPSRLISQFKSLRHSHPRMYLWGIGSLRH